MGKASLKHVKGGCDVKSRLEKELKRLQSVFGLGLDLHVVWMPSRVKYNVDGNPPIRRG